MVQLTSRIDNAQSLARDIFRLRAISLYASNQKLDTVPIVSGLKDPSVVNDGNYSTTTRPINESFSITFKFASLQIVDYIIVISNCGDGMHSEFCDNLEFRYIGCHYFIHYFVLISYLVNICSQIHRINASNGRLGILPDPLTSNVDYKVWSTYATAGECDTNILIHNEEASWEETCGFACEECLQYMFVDLNTKKIQLSAEDSSMSAISSCECPVFEYKIIGLHDLEIRDSSGRKYGEIMRGGNRRHDQVFWTYWKGEEQFCKQHYVPDIEDFLTIPSISCWYATSSLISHCLSSFR